MLGILLIWWSPYPSWKLMKLHWSPTLWTLPIVKHETNVIMNLNIGWGGLYNYSLRMGRILHLYVGIISLPLLRNRWNLIPLFSKRDINGYRMLLKNEVCNFSKCFAFLERFSLMQVTMKPKFSYRFLWGCKILVIDSNACKMI
jgi:hypothetical protein